MRPAFIGVDVAFAKAKHLPISICTWEAGRLIPQRLRHLTSAPPRGEGNVATLNDAAVRRFARQAAQYVLDACDRLHVAPACIAIDAPSAPCSPMSGRRAAERALDAAGINCFATPSAESFAKIRRKVVAHLQDGGTVPKIPHSNQLWMLVGFALFEELSNLAPCIEVFPQATVRAIGAAAIHKSAPGAVELQLTAAGRYTGWPRGESGEPHLSEIAWGDTHDQLDAYLSAWVAALPEADRVAFGEPPHDAIWVPRTGDAASQAPSLDTNANAAVNAPKHRATSRLAPSATTAAKPMLCPACGKHEFKRWPWGWDAHAAHSCAGLTGTDAVARKADYRRRFAHLFSVSYSSEERA